MRSRSPRTFLERRKEQNAPTTDYSDPAHRLGKFNAVPETPRIGDQERPWSITLPENPDEGISSRRPSYQVLQRARQAADDDDPRSRPPVPEKDLPAGSGAPRSQAQGSSQTQSPATGSSRLPHRYEGPVIDKTVTPVELPVPGDDSSEEIVMSSTAYPGQEWRPAGFSGWEY